MTDLIQVSDKASALLHVEDDGDFKSLAKNVSFLAGFKLFNAQSGAVMRRKIAAAHFGLVKGKDDIHDFGDSVDIIPIAHRFKAVLKHEGEYLSYYKRKSEPFLRAEAMAKADKQSGCMAGIEFLIWIPELSVFSLWYCFTTSTLGAADSIQAQYLKPTTVKSRLVETKKFSWFEPEILRCSTELAPPTDEQLTDELTRFRNPKEATVEVDENSASQDRPT